MSKFCTHCGAQIGDSNFCPECGQAQDNTGSVSHSSSPSNSQKSNNKESVFRIRYFIVILFSTLYIILPLLNWFKLSIPDIGEFSMGALKFHIWNIYGGFDTLFNYVDAGAAEIWAKLFAVILILLAALTIYWAIAAIHRAVTHQRKATEYLSGAAVVSIIESALVIIVMLILKAVVKGYLEDDLGYFAGTVINYVAGFTAAPIVLLISGIAGKIVANKLTYAFSCDRNDSEYKVFYY